VETRRAAEQGLAELDAAIAAAEAALVRAPDNVHLESMLTRARRQQAEYVQSARMLLSDQ
jgi:hypothetical protein